MLGNIGWGKEGDVGVSNGLAVWPNDPPHEFCAVFLDALHEDVTSLDIDSDGIESADFAHGIGQRAAPLHGLGHGKVLQLVIDEGDVVMLR